MKFTLLFVFFFIKIDNFSFFVLKLWSLSSRNTLEILQSITLLHKLPLLINNDLHRSKVFSLNFENELKEIRKKYKYADHPRPLVESVIQNFKEKQISTEKTKLMEILNHSFPSDYRISQKMQQFQITFFRS